MMQKIPRAFVGWNILVVDDERDSLEVATRLLKFAGATVTPVNNGYDALQHIKQDKSTFRFILTDLSMPEMDGWELLYQLKQDLPLLDIPIIALTAHAMAGDRERGMAAGFHNYITKPLDPNKFIHQLVNLLVDIPELASSLNVDTSKSQGVSQ
ncbi:MAG: response regulator [Armatimonadetes bacterium]|nr:response regulator [Anaerolineae bacterium]